MSVFSESLANTVAEHVRKIRFSTGTERTGALEKIFELAKEDKYKLALCQPSVGLIDALRHTLQLTDDAFATSWAVSCVGRMSASVKQNKEYLASPEVGIVPELVRLITRPNCRDNVYVFFGNCILNATTVPYLLSESLGLVEAAKREIETNPDYKFVYTFFANAVTIMSNQFASLFVRLRVHEVILNRLIQAGPDPKNWPDRNTGAVYRAMGFVTSFSTLEDGRRAIHQLGKKQFFRAFLQTSEKERMQASIIMANVYGREDDEDGVSVTKSLLQTYPDIQQLLINLLAAILDYNSESKEVKDYRNMGLAFGVTKLRDCSSALRCLSISDGNKALLLKHPTFMNHILRALQLFIDDAPECGALYQGFQSYAGGGGKDLESIENLLELLLQLSFYYEDEITFQREFNKPEYQLSYRLKCLLNLAEVRQLSFSSRQFTLELLHRLEPLSAKQGEDYHQQRALYRSTSTAIEKPQHIMISYAANGLTSASVTQRQQVMALAKQLRTMGYEVWTDTEGSTLVPAAINPASSSSSVSIVAEAIQQSYMVILCLSKEYRDSVTCRSEAKYCQARQQSHDLRLLYVMLDEGYHTKSRPPMDGWLSFMVGSQPWYPLWTVEQVEGTAESIATLVGQHAQVEINQSLRPTPVMDSVSSSVGFCLDLKSSLFFQNQSPPPPPLFPVKISDTPPAMLLPVSSGVLSTPLSTSTITTVTPSIQSSLPPAVPLNANSVEGVAIIPDYELAWSILHDPKKIIAQKEEDLQRLLEELGLYEASELEFVEEEQIVQLLSHLKPVPQKKFKVALALP